MLQVGFLSGICIPCCELIAKLIPSSFPLLEGCKKNLKRWKELQSEARQSTNKNDDQSSEVFEEKENLREEENENSDIKKLEEDDEERREIREEDNGNKVNESIDEKSNGDEFKTEHQHYTRVSSPESENTNGTGEERGEKQNLGNEDSRTKVMTNSGYESETRSKHTNDTENGGSAEPKSKFEQKKTSFAKCGFKKAPNINEQRKTRKTKDRKDIERSREETSFKPSTQKPCAKKSHKLN